MHWSLRGSMTYRGYSLNKIMRLIVIVMILIPVVAIPAQTAQNKREYFSHLKPEHQEVMKKWLLKRPGLRPAIEEDASRDDLSAWRADNRDFFPYYSVGDFNRDGKVDFAVMLKIISADDDSVIAVFNAPFRASKPAYFRGGFGLAQYYLEYQKEVNMLYVTAYETHGFYLKPKGQKYIELDPHQGLQ